MQEFFVTHPAFTYEKFADYLALWDPGNVKTRKALLTHYAKANRLARAQSVCRRYLRAVGKWGARMVKETRTRLKVILQLNNAEREFIDRLLDHAK